MKITTTRKSNPAGRPQIVARGLGGKQKTSDWDLSKSPAWNHGTAAGALIIHVQRTSPELQYGDNIISAAVRSIDGGYSEHDSNDSGTVHKFDI